MHRVSRSLMHCCRGIAVTVPVSAPRLCGAWDRCILFHLLLCPSKPVFANTAPVAQLMHTNLQGWASLMVCPSPCFAASTLTQPSELQPHFFPSVSFQDCGFFFWDFSRKSGISSYSEIRAVSGAAKAFYKRRAALLLGTASHGNLQLES